MTKRQFHETRNGHDASRHRLYAAVGGVLLAATAATPAQAVALGEVHVRSSLGEPLIAEVSLPAGDRDGLEVTPAPAAAYSRHGLQAPEHLGRITATVVRTADGRQALRITSTGPVNDPIVDLLVQARDQLGRLERQLTMLVNPAQMAAGARRGSAAPIMRATRRPAGVAVQDVRPSTPVRAQHPVRKKKVQPKVRRQSQTAAAAVRKPVVVAAQSKTTVISETLKNRAPASAAALKDGADQPGKAGAVTPHGDPAAMVTGSRGSAVARSAVVAPGAAAPASGAANAPGANASGDASAASALNAPKPPISAADDGANSVTEAPADAGLKSRLTAPVAPKTSAPAERSVGYERWGGPTALLALLLAGGLVWQWRRQRERLLETADGEVTLDDDLKQREITAARAPAAAKPVQPHAQGAAVSPVAATHESGHESLPDFGVTRAVPEDDPVAQADVYLSAGKVDEARTALEEGLLLDGDHIVILSKLLSIHADQRDVGAFNESAARLAQETARSRQAWRQACEIGHRLDPANALYAGDAPAARGSDLDVDGGGSAELPPPGASLPGVAAAGGSTAAAASTLALALMAQEACDDTVSLAPLDGAGANGMSARPLTGASDGMGSEPGSAESSRVERDLHAAEARRSASADVTAAGPEVTAPVAGQETAQQVVAAEPAGERAGPPRDASPVESGAADAESFDRLPSLLKQATQRADDGDRQGAIELATEVARLLAALRHEALALVPNSYA